MPRSIRRPPPGTVPTQTPSLPTEQATVLPPHGCEAQFQNVEDAVAFVDGVYPVHVAAFTGPRHPTKTTVPYVLAESEEILIAAASEMLAKHRAVIVAKVR